MAAPLAIAGASIVVAGAIGQAYTAYASGRSNREYYRFLADQSRLKSKWTMEVSDQNINAIYDSAARQGKQLKDSVNQAEATQKAQMIAQGMSLNSVTAEDILKDNISKMQLDEMAIRYNAELAAYNTKRNAIMQSFDFNAQASSQELSGNMAYWTGQQQGLSSLIGGAGNALMMYSALNQGGANSSRERGPAQKSGSPTSTKSTSVPKKSIIGGYGGTKSYGSQSGYK